MQMKSACKPRRQLIFAQTKIGASFACSDMVPVAGLEPARGVTTLDFESSASTNSATAARSDNQNKIYFTIKAGRVQEGNLE